MKKQIFFILIQLVFINAVYGRYVDTTTAKTVATNFFVSRISQSKQARVKSLSAQKIEIELVHQEFDDSVALNNQYNKEPYYYVYNVKDNNGFIIVSADDAVTPILGYAFEGKYDSINQPPAFIEWMSNFKKQLKSIKVTKSNVLSHVKSEWSKIKTANTITNETTSTEVAPLLTTTWNQTCYYNSYCPQDVNALVGHCGHVRVGCVAVAMAQIINYWKYPNTCNDIPGYSSRLYGWMPNINSTTYNWANMADSLTDSTSATKVNAVAELLYHCGVAVQMDYAVGGSGASSDAAANALFKFFNYSSSVELKMKSNYSTVEWKSLLNNELDHSRPLLYLGQGPSGGHAFVCDGYQNSDYYHFNWGHGGNFDGYFYIDNLNPGGVTWNDGQEAIIGISPVSLPVIDYSNYEIKDGGSGASIGNGNGIAEAGETIELPITLKNIGLGTSNNVIATLSCEDTDITITNSTQGWGSIAPDSIKTSANYIFNIPSSFPAKNVTFTLRITSVEDSWTKVFTIHVYKTTSVKIDVAGTLNTLLTPSEKTSTSLILTGTIDARDFKTMRDSFPMLSGLDINNATIVAYTGTEGTATSTSTTYPANTIPQNAFYNLLTNQGKVTLNSVIMPSTITSIGSCAFNYCSGLTGSLTIPSSVTSIGASAFNGCAGLNGSLVIPLSVTSVGDHAFHGCSGIKSISLPANITAINGYTFENCSSLTSVNIPSSITSIGSYAFDGCSRLTSITIPSSVTSIGDYAFYFCYGLTGSLTIPSSVTSIGNFSFYKCNKLTSLSIPLSVTTIGSSAFAYCSGLTGSLTILSTVTSIGNSSFYACNKLTSLSIPSSVTTIGNSAFAYCSGLTSILTYKTTPINLSSSTLVFDGVNKTTCTLSVPNGTKSTYQTAVQWKDFSNIVEFVTAVPTLNEESVSIYPNPVTDGFQIKGIEGIADFRLTDLYGKLLLHKQVRANESVSVSALPAGMYIINIFNNGVSYQKKVLKK